MQIEIPAGSRVAWVDLNGTLLFKVEAKAYSVKSVAAAREICAKTGLSPAFLSGWRDRANEVSTWVERAA